LLFWKVKNLNPTQGFEDMRDSPRANLGFAANQKKNYQPSTPLSFRGSKSQPLRGQPPSLGFLVKPIHDPGLGRAVLRLDFFRWRWSNWAVSMIDGL